MSSVSNRKSHAFGSGHESRADENSLLASTILQGFYSGPHSDVNRILIVRPHRSNSVFFDDRSICRGGAEPQFVKYPGRARGSHMAVW